MCAVSLRPFAGSQSPHTPRGARRPGRASSDDLRGNHRVPRGGLQGEHQGSPAAVPSSLVPGSRVTGSQMVPRGGRSSPKAN